MTLIYQSKGKAREYSNKALNVYTKCSNHCNYCYARLHPWYNNKGEVMPRKNFINQLEKELAHNPPKEQVLLSFLSDPYCIEEEKYGLTREVLEWFYFYDIPTAILTKGGSRCLRDIGLFETFNAAHIPLKVGATLTFINPKDSLKYEPGAALPDDRLNTLKTLHDAGIRTWASLEPVIDPEQTLALIDASHEFVDEYRVGKWNYDPRADKIDWGRFGKEAIELLRRKGKFFYIKADLRKYLSIFPELTPEECDMDYLNLKTEGK